jgi:recombination associated protein RdgC
VANQWVMRFMTEAKMLPASVQNRRVEEKAAHIEATEGRKPGKKEKKELKDEAKLDLLPMAFTKQGAMWVWIDPQARTLVLDTGSQARADEVVSMLWRACRALRWPWSIRRPAHRPRWRTG